MILTDTLQSYIADATHKTADALLAAFMNLPPDKRDWLPMGHGRSAIDQVAECAIVNGGVVQALAHPESAHSFDVDGMAQVQSALAADWNTLQTTFETNTEQLVARIRKLRDDELGTVIHLPWGMWSIAHLVGHPYWNMAYHEGQINYIASLL